MNKIIDADSAPAAIGPYSQAVTNGNLLFVSGQLPIEPGQGVIVSGDIAEQARQSLENAMFSRFRLSWPKVSDW